MKIIHTSDLHLGKRLNGYLLIEDQRYILNQIVDITKKENADAVIIAGDVYDKSIPSIEAVQLFNDFLVKLSTVVKNTFVVSGNHDSSERLAFGSDFIKKSGIYISPVYNGNIMTVKMEDEYGSIDIHLLPFIKPTNIRPFFEDVTDYTDAVKKALSTAVVNPLRRNVLIAHQFVTGSEKSESEDITVGTLDNVDAKIFNGFDYVALGHIHKAQKAGNENIRYSGTPLKYSFSEVNDEKTVTVIDLKNKWDTDIKKVLLIPKRDLREVRGSYEEIMDKNNYEGTKLDDYMHITLTDEDDIPEVVNKLRTVYPNIMKVDYDNKRTRSYNEVEAAEVEKKSPLVIFSELFELQNNEKMTEKQELYLSDMIKALWENNEEVDEEE